MTVRASLGHPLRVWEVRWRGAQVPPPTREVEPPSGFVASGRPEPSSTTRPTTATWRRRLGVPGTSRPIVREPWSPFPLPLMGLPVVPQDCHRPRSERRPPPTPVPSRKPSPFGARPLSRTARRRPRPRHRLPQRGGTARRRREPRGLLRGHAGIPGFSGTSRASGNPQGDHGHGSNPPPPSGHESRPWETTGFKSLTQGKSGTTSPVWASPVSSSIPARPGPSKHNGQTGHPRPPRGCTDSARPGHVIRSHHHCHSMTPTGSKGNATSNGSRQHDGRSPSPSPSVGSKPHSVKHRNSM